MPRVKQQTAAKDYPDQGIVKGEKYYKWSFRYGGTYKSKTYPKPSQLTQGKASQVYGALESIHGLCGSDGTLEDIVAALDEGAGEVREVGGEYEEADEAMGGHQGTNYERSEACEELASAMEDLAGNFSDVSVGPTGEYTDMDEALDALKEECSGLEYNEV